MPTIRPNTALVNPASADRYANRAPRGGMVSPTNGRFYRGGTWMPMAATPVEFKPAPLVGSSRQTPWATRLRARAIARLEEQLHAARMELACPNPFDVAGTRRAIRRDEVARYGLMVERSAAAIIDRRAAFA